MGFLDGFNKGLTEGRAASYERQSQSSYKTVKQQDEEREAERIKKLRAQSNGALLQKLKNRIYTSEDEKKDIEEELKSRGYKKIRDRSQTPKN